MGMFISRDPIELLGGYNVFQHAPNPIHWIDPQGLDVYELTARANGWFPVYKKGSKEPVAYQFLQAGETYKFGESKNSNNRYTDTQLNEGRIHQPSKTNGQKFTSFGVDANGKVLFSTDANGNIVSTQPAGLDRTPLGVGGTKTQDRIQETNLINNYRNTHGKLPPGNKTCH